MLYWRPPNTGDAMFILYALAAALVESRGTRSGQVKIITVIPRVWNWSSLTSHGLGGDGCVA
jgi:hypothetical protein